MAIAPPADQVTDIQGTTAGSVIFVGAGGACAEDNDNLFWDNSNKRLGVGTNAPTTALGVAGDISVPFNWGTASDRSGLLLSRPDAESSQVRFARNGASFGGTRFGLSEANAAQFYTDSAADDAAYLIFGTMGSIPLHFGTANTLAVTIDSSQNVSIVAGNLTVTGDINPEADGTRDLGTQTTAQWANVWSDLINGAEIGLENEWRLMESDLFEGYPKGFAVGHSEKWVRGKSIWHGDREKYMSGVKPVFAVTDEFIEYRGRRITPEMLDRLLAIAGGE